MEKLTITDIISFTSGKQLISNTNQNVDIIITDNRDVKPNCLFIPIIGETHDGHKFMEAAYDAGCRNFLIDENHSFQKEDINLIEVKDTILALGDIAKNYRLRYNIPFIGITGSVGKTSTKDMIYSVLNEKYTTLKTLENYNNNIGLPKTLLNLNKKTEIAIIEMGMDQKGQISYLSGLTLPETAVITNIGMSHIMNFENQEGIFQAKMEITENLKNSNTLIINGDDNFLKTLKDQKLPYNLITCGFEENNDIRCINYQINNDNITFTAKYNNQEEEFTIPTLAKHNILNALIAIAIGSKYNLTLSEIKQGLANYTPSSNRLDIIKINKYTIINDTYNASYDSMKSALEVLNTFNTRKVAILGDIFELGEKAKEIHSNVGKLVNSDILITIGDNSKYIGESAKNINPNNYSHFNTKEEFYKEISNLLKPNDTILIKASHGMNFKEIVDFLKS